MLQDLPLELLIYISSQLTLVQKVECRLVCRRWAKVIKDSCFLEHVFLTQQEDYLDLIDLVQEEELHGNQVKTLFLNECGLAPIDVFTLADYFPNIKKLEWNDKQETLLSELTLNDHENIKCWGESLESITMRTPYSITASILWKSTFTRLTKLTVGFVVPHDEIGKVELLQSLKQAPALDAVELDCVSLTVEDVELLHANAPELKNLTLSHAGLLPMLRKDFTPVLDEVTKNFRFDLKPAPKLTSFQFTDSSSFCDNENYWLKYISEKYTHLENLYIDCELPEVRVIFIADNFDFADTFHDGLFKLASKCRKLKAFNVNKVPLTSSIYDALDANMVQLEEITIDQYDDTTPLEESLDDPKWRSRCQKLKRLNIYHCQQQPFCKRELLLLPQLTHLTIKYTPDMLDEVLYIDQLLYCLPALTTLVVSDYCVVDAKNTTLSHSETTPTAATTLASTSTSTPYKLKEFVISNCTFSRNLLSFINNCCHLINRLSFIKAVPLWITPFEIHLPALRLNVLRLEFQQLFKIQFNTEDNHCLEYISKPKETSGSVNPDTLTLISIQCKYIQHLYINGIAKY